ncbi:putative protein YjdB, contains Ig-like domain [Histomonas meleagridis]|uniref:putative protein YjdB, contains Ig-like domain n=1 Tax=Histomonas meleagridis TaxID=135588 RepID=UPI00355A8F42|nr:putative protein YjdB, contains Ig-like domain [Histomonas meleagridis]
MEGGTIKDDDEVASFNPIGVDPNTSKQLISVTLMSINDFEDNVSNDPSFIYEYDVIFIGSWDANSCYNIKTETAKGILTEYISKGYGVIAGHDTITHDWNVNDTDVSLLSIRELFGITSRGTEDNYTYPNGTIGNPDYQNIFSTNIFLRKKGHITNYPYQIGNIGNNFAIRLTHTTFHATIGD